MDSQVITGAISKPPIGDQAVVILVYRDDNNDHDHRDTPANQRKLKHVAWYVAVEDFHQGQVHVDRLKSHPGEGSQQEVVEEPGGGDAEALSLRVERQPGVHQEDQVQHQQGQTQLDQDFGWNVFTQLPAVFQRFREHKISQWVFKGAVTKYSSFHSELQVTSICEL